MDISAAFRILQERQAQPSNTIVDRPEVDDVSAFNGQVIETSALEIGAAPAISLEELYEEQVPEIVAPTLTTLGDLQLLNQIMEFQAVRVRVYALYNR